MATTVWHNDKVSNNEHETSDAISASDGVIVAHGADALAMSADEKIDLKGATLLPGFGDGHAHPVFGGIETLFAPVRGPEKLEQLLEAIKTWADENPDAPWVRGEGYDPSLSPNLKSWAWWQLVLLGHHRQII
jgi:predicted amidohydrolase YtcJ